MLQLKNCAKSVRSLVVNFRSNGPPKLNFRSPYATSSRTTRNVPEDRYNIGHLTKYVEENRNVYLKYIRNILDDSKETNKLQDSEITLLLKQCGSSIPNESCQSRDSICQEIYKNFKRAGLSVDFYHTYVSICTQNRVLLNCDEIIGDMKCQPGKTTYKLLLRNVCEKGDVGQALSILNEMKRNDFAIDEEVFTYLVLGHTISGGREGGEAVLKTMKTAQIPETDSTKFAIIKGAAKRETGPDDFNSTLSKYQLNWTEEFTLNIFEELGLARNTNGLNEVFRLIDRKQFSRDFFIKLDKLCIFLIHNESPDSAVAIFTRLTGPSPAGNYGVFLFREMLHSKTPSEQVIELALSVRDAGLNENIFAAITELALRHRYSRSAWTFLEYLPHLRPHFFWPLLIDSYQREGETGLFSTIERMLEMKVPVDAETLEDYCLRFCDPSEPQHLIQKLKEIGLSAKEIVNSLLVVLLSKDKITDAVNICGTYDVKLTSQRLLKKLPHSWKKSLDSRSVVLLLRKLCEANDTEIDYVGEFLTKALKLCENEKQLSRYLDLLRAIRESGLRINSSSFEGMQSLAAAAYPDPKRQETVQELIESVLDYGMKMDTSQIPHPKNMNVEELECHLIELKSKAMETRGVLRKLIQRHSAAGNFDRVKELRRELSSSGYKVSPGTISSSIHSLVRSGDLDAALTAYNELKSGYVGFKLDDFKIVDLAALMVKRGRLREAGSLIDEESKTGVRGGVSIERNCWNLLNSYEDEAAQREMFDLLLNRGYCKPSNVILGPLVRLPLNRGDLRGAVELFASLGVKYKRTPLKLELLCAALRDKTSDRFVSTILEGVSVVHGSENADESLFLALCEVGDRKELGRFLAQRSRRIPDVRLRAICDKWIAEDKLNCLVVLMEFCDKAISVLNKEIIYKSIIKIYCKRGDCDGAIAFYEKLREKEVPVDGAIEKDLVNLLSKCNVQIPDELKTVMKIR